MPRSSVGHPWYLPIEVLTCVLWGNLIWSLDALATDRLKLDFSGLWLAYRGNFRLADLCCSLPSVWYLYCSPNYRHIRILGKFAGFPVAAPGHNFIFSGFLGTDNIGLSNTLAFILFLLFKSLHFTVIRLGCIWKLKNAQKSVKKTRKRHKRILS